jgi:hypothetical protein
MTNSLAGINMLEKDIENVNGEDTVALGSWSNLPGTIVAWHRCGGFYGSHQASNR